MTAPAGLFFQQTNEIGVLYIPTSTEHLEPTTTITTTTIPQSMKVGGVRHRPMKTSKAEY